MKMADRIKQAVKRFQQISLSGLFIILVSVIVMITSVVSLLIFVNLYRNDMEQNAITTSEQAVVQVKNTVFNYTEDMSDIMQMIWANIQKEEEEANNFFSNLLKIRSDVVAVTSYDMNGKILKCWTNGQKLKENYIKNLSYVRDLPQEEGILNITKPHVESLFVDYYPWVLQCGSLRPADRCSLLPVISGHHSEYRMRLLLLRLRLSYPALLLRLL